MVILHKCERTGKSRCWNSTEYGSHGESTLWRTTTRLSSHSTVGCKAVSVSFGYTVCCHPSILAMLISLILP